MRLETYAAPVLFALYAVVIAAVAAIVVAPFVGGADFGADVLGAISDVLEVAIP